MRKYRIIHNFLVTNKKYLKKLEKFSKKGWHFKKYLGIVTLLEQGEEKNYKYELVYDRKFDKERKEFYSASGWEVVRNSFFWQILRGEEDATELYTDSESKAEMWKFRVKFTVLLSMVCFFISLVSFTFRRFVVYDELFKFFQGAFVGLTCSLIVLDIAFYIFYRLELRKDDD